MSARNKYKDLISFPPRINHPNNFGLTLPTTTILALLQLEYPYRPISTMPNILLLGGTGLLGTSLSHSLLRTGLHKIFIQTRSASNSLSLLAQELTPLVFPLSDTSALTSALKETEIDIVIDTSQAYAETPTILTTLIEVAKPRKEALKAEGAVGPKLGFIYTSGIMVHGSPSRSISDLSPVGNSLASSPPAEMVAWRPAMEQAILSAREELGVVIMRPGMLYGRSAWNFGVFWGPIAAVRADAEKVVKIKMGRETRLGLVHVDDVADAYTVAVDKIDGGMGNWPVFDIVSENIGLPEILEATLEAVGLEGKEVVYEGTGGDVVMEGLGLRARGTSSRARSILGWEARRRDFLGDVGVLYRAWEAAGVVKGGE